MATPDFPSMVSQSDIALFAREAGRLRDATATIVEFGPWLGAVSAVLADKGRLHVVDSFEWTRDHARRVPDLAAPGDSFRAAYEGRLAELGLSAIVHETRFSAFHWDGRPVDLVVLDAPKTASDLHDCLGPIMAALKPGARVLLKHGLDPMFPDMAAHVEALVDGGWLTIPAQAPDAGCSVAILERGDRATPGLPDPGAAAMPTGAHMRAYGLAPDHPFHFAPLVGGILAGNWPAAFEALSQMPPTPALIGRWDKLEPKIAGRGADDYNMAALAEVMGAHHGTAARSGAPVAFHASPARAWRGYWLNREGKPGRGTWFQPRVLERAYEFGYLGWSSKIREHVAGKDVLDIGCGPGLHGIGYLAAGAKSYVGLDPIVKPDRDRVKNLAARGKEAFGWTPNELAEILGPWIVSPEPLEDTDPSLRFDIAILHNVTEHLHALDSIFAAAAQRLRPGGRLLYNHHNFYSWNGHHLPPKTISAIDLSDPGQREMIDWGHVEYDPAPEHYIARGLNRIRLDEILDLTRKYFDIQLAEEIPSKAQTGHNRLTDEIRQRYPYLADRDFLTQNLFCIATVRG